MGAIRYDIETRRSCAGRTIWWIDRHPKSSLNADFSAHPGRRSAGPKLSKNLGRDRGGRRNARLDVQITRLRRKIEDNPKQPALSAKLVRGRANMSGTRLDAP